ncbi:MAG: WG repeat-containing protein [Clostridia bacterium]|nr:WG repeat-containing protein [Clostridia bacterium]
MKKTMFLFLFLVIFALSAPAGSEEDDPWTAAGKLIREGMYSEALEAFRTFEDSDAALPYIEALSISEHADMVRLTDRSAGFLFHGLWGFVTFPEESDPICVAPRWTSLSVLSDGLFLTGQEWDGSALYGIVTEYARVLYPCSYSRILLSGTDRLILYTGTRGPALLASVSEYSLLSPPCLDIRETGTSAFAFRDMESSLWGLMDRDGQVLAEPLWDDIGMGGSGLFPVLKGGLWGYIDASGNEVIPFSYLEADAFQNGCADVRDLRNGWRIISTDGSVLFFRDDLAEFDPEIGEYGPSRESSPSPADEEEDMSGEYTVHALGYNDYVFVTVTLGREGQILKMSVDASCEDRDRGRHAEEIAFTDRFTGKKGPFVLGEGIDGITGATATVNAVLEALNSLYEE